MAKTTFLPALHWSTPILMMKIKGMRKFVNKGQEHLIITASGLTVVVF